MMSYIAEIPYVGWVPPFLVVLGVVVFIHEYGHYIVGRHCTATCFEGSLV